MSYCEIRFLFHNHLGKIGVFRIRHQFRSLRMNQYTHVLHRDGCQQWFIVAR